MHFNQRQQQPGGFAEWPGSGKSQTDELLKVKPGIVQLLFADLLRSRLLPPSSLLLESGNGFRLQ
jgi:hypothetical protein